MDVNVQTSIRNTLISIKKPLLDPTIASFIYRLLKQKGSTTKVSQLKSIMQTCLLSSLVLGFGNKQILF